MESLLAKYSLTLPLQAATRPGAVGESCSGSAGWGALATISASLSSFFGIIAMRGTLVSRFRSSQALAAHFRVNFGIKNDRRQAIGLWPQATPATRHEAKPAPTSVCGLGK